TRRVSTLSASLVQRLRLAQSLIGSPRAILLDETLCGEGLLFDPDVVSVLTRLTRRGITVILAAPNPVELHRIAARTINIVEGRVVTLRLESTATGRIATQSAFELPANPQRQVGEQS
ncbi:MAG TPA: hypothetical protein VN876_04395, partial [Gemmatimonadaceae bacterium]|nr:hypothetical protein [Gemmatimonadaceae bacterium]